MAKIFCTLKTLVIVCCIFYVHDTILTIDVCLLVLQEISPKVSHVKNMYIVVTMVTVANSNTNLILQLNVRITQLS